MLNLHDVSAAGIKYGKDLLWIAALEERLVATFQPSTGKMEGRIEYPHEVFDLCPDGDELWLMTGGGRLGRQVVRWSLKEEKEILKFNCPDGSGAGIALCNGKLWLPHRHNRKLFCLDPGSGKVSWIIRTENEVFSPTAYGNELWFVECDPGPMGHWSQEGQRYYFSRYDPARERVAERLPVPFAPACMTVGAERFWYAEQGKKGVAFIGRSI